MKHNFPHRSDHLCPTLMNAVCYLSLTGQVETKQEPLRTCRFQRPYVVNKGTYRRLKHVNNFERKFERNLGEYRGTKGNEEESKGTFLPIASDPQKSGCMLDHACIGNTPARDAITKKTMTEPMQMPWSRSNPRSAVFIHEIRVCNSETLRGDVLKLSYFWCCLVLFGAVWCSLVLKFVFAKTMAKANFPAPSASNLLGFPCKYRLAPSVVCRLTSQAKAWLNMVFGLHG